MPDFDYTGRYAYHLVTVTTDREPLLVDETAGDVASVLAESSAATKFDLLAYVGMPDHAHVLALGVADEANVIRFMQRFKQVTGFRYKRRCAGALWQHSFYDKALRRDEDVLIAAGYVLGNPVRAGLMTADDVWPYQGGVLLTGAEAPPLRVQGHASDATREETP
jgi:putative transposase